MRVPACGRAAGGRACEFVLFRAEGSSTWKDWSLLCGMATVAVRPGYDRGHLCIPIDWIMKYQKIRVFTARCDISDKFSLAALRYAARREFKRRLFRQISQESGRVA